MCKDISVLLNLKEKKNDKRVNPNLIISWQMWVWQSMVLKEEYLPNVTFIVMG